MKKLRIIVLLVVVMAGLTSTAIAQFSIGANAGVGMSVGSFAQKYNMGFGGTANATYTLKENMSIGFNAGFYAFKGSDFPANINQSTRIIPIFADFKYFFDTEGFMPYVGAGIGMYLVSESHTTPDIPANIVGGATLSPAIPSEEKSSSNAKFGVAPTLGFWLGDGLKYGANVTYNIIFSDASYIGVNIGVIYPLGK